MTAENVLVQAANAAPLRLVCCERCGMALDEFSSTIRTKVGPCCESIVARGSRDRGRYTDDDIDEEPYEVEYEEGTCQSCGGTDFNVQYREAVTNYCWTRATTDRGTVRISYDYSEQSDSETHDTTIEEINCRGCGASYVGDHEW